MEFSRYQKIYLGCLLALALYREWVVSPFWLDGYLLYLPGIVFLPLWLVSILGCQPKGRSGLAALVLSSVIIFVVLIPVRIHWRSDSDAKAFRVVSLNIFSYETDLKSCVLKLKELNPDIISFQEIWRREHLELLEEGLGEYDFVGTKLDAGVNVFFYDGVFLAVRKGGPYKVVESFSAPRLVGVVLQSQEKKFAIFGLHGAKAKDWYPKGMQKTAELQRLQAAKLDAMTKMLSIPWVVAGDFNAPSSGPAFKLLGAKSAFLDAGTGLGLTFPARHPFVGLDHILGSKGIRFLDFDGKDLGSDHLGVFADFQVNQDSLSTQFSSSGLRRHSD